MELHVQEVSMLAFKIITQTSTYARQAAVQYELVISCQCHRSKIVSVRGYNKLAKTRGYIPGTFSFMFCVRRLHMGHKHGDAGANRPNSGELG